MQKFHFLILSVILPAFVYSQAFQHQDGLYYEVPDSVNLKNEHFFNMDNTVYTPGKEFIFSYKVIKNGDSLRVRIHQSGDTKTKNWSFVKPGETDSLTIVFFGIEVQFGYGGLDQLFPDYSQTVISQNYYSSGRKLLFDGSTGMVENRKNTWLHPFRGKYFSVLEFSPFPYIKFPLEPGTEWTWKLDDISERWSDERIKSYQGKQKASYTYKIVGKEKIESRFGPRECYVTEATATTSLGLTKLTSYFNPELGFMKLHYSNIDGSRIQIELTEIRQHK